jgi:hypothetical protein
LTVPDIFNIGNVEIEKEILHGADNLLKYLDLNYYETCKLLKLAPNDEKKREYFDRITNQQEKANAIVLAIQAYDINKDSKTLEETLADLLKSNLKSELSPKQESEIKGILIDKPMKGITSDKDVKGVRIGKISKDNVTIKGLMEDIKGENVTRVDIDEV